MILGIPSRPGLRVLVASQPVDFRKGMDGLVALVTQALTADPFAGDVFVFRAKRTVTDASTPPRGASMNAGRLPS